MRLEDGAYEGGPAVFASGPAGGPPGAAAAADRRAWQPVCALDDILPDTGVCALVGGRQVAVVRLGDGDEVYAIDNFDPFSRAFVLSRGIVGDRGGVPKIASPIFKQSFDLRTGQCLDAPDVAVAAFPARVRGGLVEVQVEAKPMGVNIERQAEPPVELPGGGGHRGQP